MTREKDHYKTLGVTQHSTQEQIKKAYRRLALLHHPDRGGDQEKFKQIIEAYDILGDPDKKRVYDERYGHVRNLFNWDATFSDFFRNIKKQRAAYSPKSDKDVKFNLGVNLEQIKRGVSKKIFFNRMVICEACKGQGGKNPQMCNDCMGSGQSTFYNSRGHRVITTCRTCGGRGITFSSVCSVCKGNKSVKKQEYVIVDISEKKSQ